MHKEELLVMLKESTREFNKLYGLNKNILTITRDYDNWDARDTLGHFVWYTNYITSRLLYLKANILYEPIIDFKDNNIMIFNFYRNISIDVVYINLVASIKEFKRVLETFDNNELDSIMITTRTGDVSLGDYLVLYTLGHMYKHLTPYYLQTKYITKFYNMYLKGEKVLTQINNGVRTPQNFQEYFPNEESLKEAIKYLLSVKEDSIKLQKVREYVILDNNYQE
jgi:hypothetical protein